MFGIAGYKRRPFHNIMVDLLEDVAPSKRAIGILVSRRRSYSGLDVLAGTTEKFYSDWVMIGI